MLPGAELGMDELGAACVCVRPAASRAARISAGVGCLIVVAQSVALWVGQPLEAAAAVEAPSVGMISGMADAAKALERAADVVRAALEGPALRRAHCAELRVSAGGAALVVADLGERCGG
jgi:hypothetical protein